MAVKIFGGVGGGGSKVELYYNVTKGTRVFCVVITEEYKVRANSEE